MLSRPTKLCLLVCCLLLGLVGCSTTNLQSSKQQRQFTYSAEHYLQLAASTPPPLREHYQLEAVRRLLRDGRIDQASQILSQIRVRELTPDARAQATLYRAEMWLINKKPHYALDLLHSLPSTDDMPEQIQADEHRLFAIAYEQVGNPVASARQRVLLDRLLPDASLRHKNEQALWTSLQQIPNSTLKNQIQQTLDETELNGWLQLAYATKQYDNDSEQLISSIQSWRQQFPEHPANELLPSTLPSPQESAPYQPTHIALLVPTSGQLAGAGEAVRNGFLAAYYQTKAKKPLPEVTVYNTNDGDISSIYQKAIDDGADLVVGPLQKTEVDSLSQHSRLQAPTLALNYSQKSRSKHNLYEFGLLPESEATQTATRAWHDGHSRTLIITPDNELGQRIASSFDKAWQSQGGETVASLAFNNEDNLSNSIEKLLNVDQSQQRADKLRGALNEKFSFIPRRRQDIDMIFLAAYPKDARQIRPLLKFYYANTLPIYATSIIYSGVNSPAAYRDLNGVIFCDIPWTIDPNNTMLSTRQSIAKLWPDSYKNYTRLYALGWDAYNLIPQLKRMQLLPKFGVRGATGILHLDPDQRIQRQLEWAEFRDGSPYALQRHTGGLS